jgi:hypothetical protein
MALVFNRRPPWLVNLTTCLIDLFNELFDIFAIVDLLISWLFLPHLSNLER